MINVSLKNNIIEHIYQEILNNNYIPGDHIKELELSEKLNVSRAPVREALSDLVNLGILVKYERKGIYLKDITAKEVLDTYNTKGMIEGYLAIDFLLNHTKKDIEHLNLLLDKMGKVAKTSTKACVEVGDEFHKIFLKYSTNEILLETLEKVNIKSHILFFKNWSKLYTVQDIVSRHKEIVDQVQKKDIKLLEKVIRNHYSETGMKIVSKLAISQ
jgi:DNA-binding GntR family transcriptional regulator